MKTKVKFLVDENVNPNLEPDIYAFFPDEPYEKEYTPELYTCYMHVGQHGSCHIDYANQSRYATHEEYMPLKEELESIGYSLTVLNK